MNSKADEQRRQVIEGSGDLDRFGKWLSSRCHVLCVLEDAFRDRIVDLGDELWAIELQLQRFDQRCPAMVQTVIRPLFTNRHNQRLTLLARLVRSED